MKPKLPLAVLTVLSLAPFSSVAQFESYPGEEHEAVFSEISVTFYAEPDFRGESITLPANVALEDLSDVRFGDGRRVNNRISSVWIEGHAHVTLYDHDDFDGDFITLMESEPDLDLVRQGRHGDWDNDASSLSVTTHLEAVVCAPGPVHGAPYPVVVGPPRYPQPSIPPPSIVVSCPIGCSHGPGSGCSRSRSRGHQDYGFGPTYHRDPTIVRKVERAYRDVLRRSPDKDGRRNYYYTMIERGWSESRLRKELRKSDEYHQQTIPAVVKKVYREELGREPDPAGFQFYTQKMSQDGWYESNLRKALKRSPEYAARTRTPSSRPGYGSHRNTEQSQPVATSRPIPSAPVVAPPRVTEVKIPTTKARSTPTVRPRPVAKPRPTRVAPPPQPRPPTTKVTTRKSNPQPPAPKPRPPERTRPAPPNLN